MFYACERSVNEICVSFTALIIKQLQTQFCERNVNELIFRSQTMWFRSRLVLRIVLLSVNYCYFFFGMFALAVVIVAVVVANAVGVGERRRIPDDTK